MTIRESLLWGAVGGLSFLVLVRGYELLADVRLDLAAKAGVAVFVAAAAAAITHFVAPPLLANGSA